MKWPCDRNALRNPVGQISVAIFDGDRFLGDFSAGETFFEAQGCGFFYIRDASRQETNDFVKLLGVQYEFH